MENVNKDVLTAIPLHLAQRRLDVREHDLHKKFTRGSQAACNLAW